MKRTLYGFVCIFALFCTIARAEVLTIQTDKDWTVTYYGTFDTSYYGEISDVTAVNLMNSTSGTVIDTRVYDDYSNILFTGNSWIIPDFNTSEWIGGWNGESLADPDYNNTFGSWNLSGYYTFSTDLILGNAFKVLEFDFWKDNAMLAILLTDLNGNIITDFSWDPVAENNYFDGTTAISNNLENIEAGNYILTFFVTNGFGLNTELYDPNATTPDWNLPHGPVGLRVHGVMSSGTDIPITPEPTTIAILGLGLAGLTLRRRFK